VLVLFEARKQAEFVELQRRRRMADKENGEALAIRSIWATISVNRSRLKMFS